MTTPFVDLHSLWLTKDQIQAGFVNRTDRYFVEFRLRRPDGWRKEAGAANSRVLFNVGVVADEAEACFGMTSGETK